MIAASGDSAADNRRFARPFVLLRGLAREARHWGAFPEHLQRVGLAERVLCLDLPGNGQKRHGRTPWSVRAIAAAIRSEAAALLGPDVRPVVLGLSLGGMVALEWARLWPTDLAGLVLINTSVGGLSRPWRRMRWGALARLILLLVSSDLQRRENVILGLSTGLTMAAPERDRTLAHWVALAADGATRRSNAVRQIAAAAGYRRKLWPAMPPALVLAGAGDRLVDPDCSRRLAHALHAPLREHPGAGHDLALDAPDWCVQQLAQWVSETDL